MVSSDLWTDIDSRLGELFMMIPEKAFAGLSVMTVADLLQLAPVRGKPIFSRFSDKDSMKNLLGLQLWYLVKYAELTEVVRQKDRLFIDLLNKVRVGNIFLKCYLVAPQQTLGHSQGDSLTNLILITAF